MPTSYGSTIYARHRPAWNAYCVSAIEDAGGIILGKTATAEFAHSAPPATRNPHVLGCTPGGSSSGSAACVADFMVPASLATQTGGSTIRPAAFCGIADRKSVVEGKSVYVRVDIGSRRIIKKKNNNKNK